MKRHRYITKGIMYVQLIITTLDKVRTALLSKANMTPTIHLKKKGKKGEKSSLESIKQVWFNFKYISHFTGQP